MECECWCKCGCEEPYFKVNHETRNCSDCDEGNHEIPPPFPVYNEAGDYIGFQPGDQWWLWGIGTPYSA